jgi:hypothetical protein
MKLIDMTIYTRHHKAVVGTYVVNADILVDEYRIFGFVVYTRSRVINCEVSPVANS